MRRRDDDQEIAAGGRPLWLPWLIGVLTDKGYDLSSERSGGRAQLARDTGLSQGIVTRLLAGQPVAYETLLTLARGTGIPLEELLVRTGKAAEDDFSHAGPKISQTDVSSGKRLTPEEVAVAAGVPDEDIAWFATMVRRMRRDGTGDGDSATGGAAAEG
ncbi:helix-turn-helix transcriptional regulator [Streptomyces sp. NPDC006172]|uniref:helix-turn-helix domain-containing protein n=1 Tax=Streptomyces sp. NPDC006172 TaxID=3154470 RepID=UPI0033C0B8FD